MSHCSILCTYPIARLIQIFISGSHQTTNTFPVMYDDGRFCVVINKEKRVHLYNIVVDSLISFSLKELGSTY